MNTATTPLAVALVSLLAAAATTVGAAPRCEAPRQPADVIACEKAREGGEALRRFVTRTQGIYQLYYGDYASARPAEGGAAETSATVERVAAVR